MADNTITSTSVWALVIGIGLCALIVGGFAGHFIAPSETIVEVDKEVPANYLVVDGENYTAVDIANLLSTDEQVELTELDEELDEHLAVRTAAVNYFLDEWQNEFEFKDVDGDYGDANETYDYEEVVEDLGLDIALEDYPNVDKRYDLLDDVTADETDIKDNEWDTEFTVEIEIDGTDYEYTINCVVEDGEADDLELTQE